MVVAIRAIFSRLRRDSGGSTAIEYGLIAILISVAATAAISTIGSWINSTFTGFVSDL